LNLEVISSARPFHRGEGLLDRFAHKIVSAPTITSDHGGKGA
jgi:hypothetical protein